MREIVVRSGSRLIVSPGSGRAERPRWACSMTSRQISAGNAPPVTFWVGELSSLPTQTPADVVGRVADEPGIAVILAGAGLSGDVEAPNCARLPVPSVTTARIMRFMRAEIDGR